MEQPANHPKSCHGCGGSGFQPADSIKSKAGGFDVEYTTVSPCDRHWNDDEPHSDAHGLNTTTPIDFATYYARLVTRVHLGLDSSAPIELAGWDSWFGRRRSAPPASSMHDPSRSCGQHA